MRIKGERGGGVKEGGRMGSEGRERLRCEAAEKRREREER